MPHAPESEPLHLQRVSRSTSPPGLASEPVQHESRGMTMDTPAWVIKTA